MINKSQALRYGESWRNVNRPTSPSRLRADIISSGETVASFRGPLNILLRRFFVWMVGFARALETEKRLDILGSWSVASYWGALRGFIAGFCATVAATVSVASLVVSALLLRDSGPRSRDLRSAAKSAFSTASPILCFFSGGSGDVGASYCGEGTIVLTRLTWVSVRVAGLVSTLEFGSVSTSAGGSEATSLVGSMRPTTSALNDGPVVNTWKLEGELLSLRLRCLLFDAAVYDENVKLKVFATKAHIGLGLPSAACGQES